MKRIILFLLTNLAIMLVLSTVIRIFGLDSYLTQQGLNLSSLLVFSLVIGFGGAFISLLISKPMAKWSTRAQVLTQPNNSTELWLMDTVKRLAQKAGIKTPEVAIFEGAPNAFATGAFKNDALVAVSTGLLASMNKEEVEAVLGHEVAHIANGDMVTMTLIQGVVNTFVVFFARVVGYFVDKVILKNENNAPGAGYIVTVIVCEIAFGILASILVAWFSRQREFRADAGAAALMGSTQPMQSALARLGGMTPDELPKSIATLGISDKSAMFKLFSTHPPIHERIQALQQLK
jgi:heat shock protein HtpX